MQNEHILHVHPRGGIKACSISIYSIYLLWCRLQVVFTDSKDIMILFNVLVSNNAHLQIVVYRWKIYCKKFTAGLLIKLIKNIKILKDT
jgi:hypothetical protein